MRWLMILCLALSACVSAEEERRQAEAREQARQKAHHAKCLEYGFRQGTPEYARCRQDFDLADRQEDAARRNAVLRHMLGQ